MALRNIVFQLTDNYLAKFGTMVNHKPLVDASFILNLDNLPGYQLNC